MSENQGVAQTKPAPMILVVDDEAPVRKLVGAMLTNLGYHVITAEAGEFAVTAFKKSHTPIDLLVTDVVAPGMSGPMLADELVKLKPELKVLFISGYDNSHVVQHYVVDKGFAYLPKPFTPDELGRKVREILQEPRAADAAHYR
jgi:two-component system cell cycle sensor histidine kinase/response regulator CckA